LFLDICTFDIFQVFSINLHLGDIWISGKMFIFGLSQKPLTTSISLFNVCLFNICFGLFNTPEIEVPLSAFYCLLENNLPTINL